MKDTKQLKARGVGQGILADLVAGLVVGTREVLGAAAGIGGHAVVGILHHFGGDGELLRELDVLDELLASTNAQ